MAEPICDSRIISVEQCDRSRCVMADAHSLCVIAVEFENDEVPTITPRDLVAKPGGPWLANIINSVVLHDTVLVDSALFDLDEVSQAHRLFPDLIKGVFIRDSIRDQVSARVDIAVPQLVGCPPSMAIQDWNRWLKLDSSEKPLMDRIHDTAPRLIPVEYAADPEITRRLMRRKPLPRGVGGRFLNSEMTVARAHFYMELARELRIPLRIDPVRSTYLQILLDELDDSLVSPVPDEVVDHFVANIFPEDDENPVVFNMNIPPVAEHVLRYAQRHRTSLRTATLEVRNSNNAKKFRDWCAQLFALREEGGNKAKVERKKMMKDFEQACEAWAGDVGDGVDFQTRTITLGDIPLVGKVLSAVGMSKHVIKDRVLRPKSSYRYFMFLNDLLREPSRRPS